jgi:hypothetical protein
MPQRGIELAVSQQHLGQVQPQRNIGGGRLDGLRQRCDERIRHAVIVEPLPTPAGSRYFAIVRR